MIPGEGFNYSNEQIRAHAGQKRVAAADKRATEKVDKEIKAAKSKRVRDGIVLGIASAATVAAVGHGAKAFESGQDLPDNRFTPEQSVPTASGEEQLTPEQLQEKAQIDAAEEAAENDMAEKATAPAETPQTVENQNFEGLDTTKIE